MTFTFYCYGYVCVFCFLHFFYILIFILLLFFLSCSSVLFCLLVPTSLFPVIVLLNSW